MKLRQVFQKFTAVQLLFISITIIAVYWQTTGFDFVLDDKMVITENKYVQKGLSGLKEIFVHDSMAGYLGENPNLLAGGRYRPLSLAFFAVLFEFFGQDKFIFHLVNIFTYLLCCLTAWSVLKILLKERYNQPEFRFSLFAAILLFAIHPLHTEVVSNIKGLDEILSLIFAMAGFWAIIKFYDSARIFYMVSGLLSLLLSFLAKESSLPFVAVIPLSLSFFRNFSLKKAFLVFTLMLIPAAFYFIIRYQALGYFISGKVNITGLMNAPYNEAGFTEKYGTIAFTILLYIKLLFFPHPLTHDYYPWQVPLTEIHHPRAILSVFVIAFLLYIAIRQLKKKSLLSFSVLYFFVTVSIVSNVFINVGTLMNERFLFLPSLAFSFFIIWGISALSQIRMNWLTYAVLLMFLAGFSWKTAERIPDWKSMKALDSADVKISKNSARANLFYAVNLYEEIQKEDSVGIKAAKTKEGLIYINRSLEIYPEYSDALKMKAGFAAEEYKLDRDAGKLLKAFTEIIKVRQVPYVDEFLNWLNPRVERKIMSEFYFNAGYNILIAAKKDYSRGLNYLNAGNALDPGNEKILFGLCVANYLSNNFPQAIQAGNQFLQLIGENADILYYTGNALVKTGKPQEGTGLLNRAFELNPEIKNRN